MTLQNIRTSFRIGETAVVWMEQYKVRSRHISQGPDGDMTIEALPTWYGGTAFRSKLEADWAATLDSLGIIWEYEPETITLPSGTVYIPDFWLPELRTWIEAKGTGVPRIEKTIELGESRACHCEDRCTCEWSGGQLVLIGHPPKPYDAWSGYEDSGFDMSYWTLRRRAWRHRGHPNWSSAHGQPAWLTRCPTCRRTGWFVMTAPLRCRACHARLTGGCHAYASGDEQLEFIDAICRPAPVRRTADFALMADAAHGNGL